jgi:hypothetical protein
MIIVPNIIKAKKDLLDLKIVYITTQKLTNP